jgi:IS30 family transposase
MGAHLLRAQRREFFRLVRAGISVEDAAACLGFGCTSGRRWFRTFGGVIPSVAAEPAAGDPAAGPTAKPAPKSTPAPKYRRLSIEEREQILAGMEREDSVRAIAELIDRDPSTVSREINKNLKHQHYRSRSAKRGRPRTAPWNYSPHKAQLRADREAARHTPAKLATNLRLRAEVQDRLMAKHSPDQISQRLRKDFPNDPEMWVSTETIYQSLYVQGRGALKRELTRHLRTGRTLRKPHRQAEQRRERIKDMVNISERPAEVADRAVPGHWEGDLILGSTESGSAIGTLVERTTRFVMLLHLPGDHTALTVQEAMIAKMAELPAILRQTLTWDQGIEMANHAQIAEATDLAIYFCDPHSPWQRGSNENTNGLLRQYFPKGTDLSFWGPGYLDQVATELNNRPRKTLEWRTPAEALDALLSNPSNPPGVALAG